MVLSIIELVVYGFTCYFSLACMIVLSIKSEIPSSLKNSGIRVLFMMPGLISAAFLMGFGYEVSYPVEVTLSDTDEIYYYGHINTNDTVINTIRTNSTTTTDEKIIINYETWSNFHLMIFLIFFVWIVYQIFQLVQRIR